MGAKKTRSRTAAQTGPGRAESTDSLHAYEQFGRLDVLEGGLAGSPFVDVNALENLAQQQLDSGHAQNAANLLHAAEHISFAALSPGRLRSSPSAFLRS